MSHQLGLGCSSRRKVYLAYGHCSDGESLAAIRVAILAKLKTAGTFAEVSAVSLFLLRHRLTGAKRKRKGWLLKVNESAIESKCIRRAADVPHKMINNQLACSVGRPTFQVAVTGQLHPIRGAMSQPQHGAISLAEDFWRDAESRSQPDRGAD